MDNDIFDSWPDYEVVAAEESPFLFEDQRPLAFSGCPLLDWKGEFLREDAVEDLPSMESFFHDPLYLPQHNVLQGTDDIFDGLDEIGSWDDFSSVGSVSIKEENKVIIGSEESGEELKEKKEERAADLRSMTREELSRYYDMTITEAAKELNVGLTLLKKKCRELDIPRWPHRKIKSMKTLIKNLQIAKVGLLKELGGNDGEVGKALLRAVEQQSKLMEIKPAMQIEENTKKLRQACFKAKYKQKRLSRMLES